MPKQFKDRDSFLDALFDHFYPEGTDVTEEDQDWFDHVAKFFDDDSGNGPNPPRRRRQNDNSNNSGGSRRRRQSQSNSGSGGYGNPSWFGSS